MIGLGVAGNLLSELILQIGGESIFDLSSQDTLILSERNWFRLALMINHFTMFLCAALIFGYLYHRNTFLEYLKIFNEPPWLIIAFWSIVILFSYPVVGYLTKINEAIPLPDWTSGAGADTFKILGNVLHMEHPIELLIALILVGILPALGEEFIFRGIVQQKLTESISNPHLAILIASLLFGLTHMQLERLLPLTFLGLLLGYSFYYTKSLIVPIVLHFLNNSLQVVSLYILAENDISKIEEVPNIPIYQVLVSLLLTFAALIYAKSRSTEWNESRSPA